MAPVACAVIPAEGEHRRGIEEGGSLEASRDFFSIVQAAPSRARAGARVWCGDVGSGEEVAPRGREQFAGEGVVRGAQAGSGGWRVRHAGGRRARGVRDAGRKEGVRGGRHHGAGGEGAQHRGRGHSVACGCPPSTLKD
jgi:hypothetical protein